MSAFDLFRCRFSILSLWNSDNGELTVVNVTLRKLEKVKTSQLAKSPVCLLESSPLTEKTDKSRPSRGALTGRFT